MAKEKLKFKISGKSIVYEGYPDHRPKDLMDILTKLGVKDDTVVPTFRTNIENADDFSDENIMTLFNDAKRARAEKKKNKSNGGGAAAPSDTPAGTAAEPEKPQKITLSYCGKQFSYEGLPSNKQHAVVQLLVKQKNVTPEIAVATFRDNLPQVALSDEAIWSLVTETRNARERSHKSTASSAAPPPAQAPEKPQAESTMDASAVAEGYAAIDELAGISPHERDQISSFIKQVLEQPPLDVAARLREDPQARTYMDTQEDSAEHVMSARNNGKITVYCQEENTNVSKIVYATPNMSYEDFVSSVEKKFGHNVALSFYEGDDIVELDDDDVLAMFLEMVSQQRDGKKIKLLCSNPANRARNTDDQLTETKAATTADTTAQTSVPNAKAYSNGELTVKEVRSYAGHTLAVYCCSFSPRGDTFVTASRDRSVRQWNVNNGGCTPLKGGHNGFVLSCDFSPKGNRVVSSSDDRTIKVWNTTSNAKVATLKGHENKVYCVQYNPTGEYIASASCDNTVRIWNADSCSKVTTLKGHTLAVFSCGFSRSDRGKYVVSGSDDRLIKIWDWEAGKEVRSLVGHVGTVWSVQFSHNDVHIVSSSMDHELKLWEAASGRCVRTLAGHKAPIHHAIFSENDKYIFSCARDWTVMVWRVDTGDHVETITGHTSTVYHLDIHGNKLLTSSLDNTLKLWSITEN